MSITRPPASRTSSQRPAAARSTGRTRLSAGGSASGHSYWDLARTPWCCLLFLLPLLAIYEVGVLSITTASVRNGADVWLRTALAGLGYQVPWPLPALVISSLLVWQWAGRFRWVCQWDTLVGMAAESLLFAFVLIVLGQMQDLLFQHTGQWLMMQVSAADQPQTWPLTVSYLGAGIYEEVLFRLLAIPVCYALGRILLFSQSSATVFSWILSSVLFSLAHYIGPGAEPWLWFSFCFRLLAGLYFAGLFVTRGFGITVGCHAAYDVLVGILLRP